MRTLFKYCFPFFPISRILKTSQRTDLFVEVTNVTKGNTVWAHFMAAKISIFTDNDLTHITDDHFEINLVAQ